MRNDPFLLPRKAFYRSAKIIFKMLLESREIVMTAIGEPVYKNNG